MSLQLNYSICQASNCSSLTFNELTGAYSSTNPTGYGAPNDDIVVSATAELNITLADGTTSILSLTSSGFPTSDKSKEFIINATDIGYNSGEQIADQIISMEYVVVTDSGSIVRKQIDTSLYCQVNCCVNSMFIDLDTECSDCMATEGARAQQAYLMLQGLKASAGCGNKSAFNKILTQLQKLCSTTACSNCK